jgi:magnesium-transporting ATPase (P-type)
VWYYLLEVNHYSILDARSIVMLLMVLFQNMHVLNCRNESITIFKIPFSNNYLLIASILFAQLLHIGVSHVPLLAEVLSLTPYTLEVWGQMMMLSLVIVVVMEIYKVITKPKITL